MATAATTVNRLAGRLRGELLVPGDPGYSAVRKPVIGTSREVLPQAVVRCAGVEDVVAAIGFVRSCGLRFALRSGGHSFAEHSSTDGLLIDLGGMCSVTVDGDLVTVEPGVRVGQLTDRLAAEDRMVPCGWSRSVGVTGAALGGGFGVFSRLYGLGCDHLVAAQVVLADGRVVWADADQEPDLYWALRGAGGGTFGAVTSLVFRTRPVVPAMRFELHFGHRDAAAVVDAWQYWAPDLDRELNAELAVVAGDDPAAPPMLVVFGVAVADRGSTEALLQQFVTRVGAAPLAVNLAAMSGRDAARHHVDPDWEPSPMAPDARPGLRVVRSQFLDRPLPARAVADLVTWFGSRRVAGQIRELEFVPWGGAFARISPQATAFPHRGARFLLRHTVQVGARASDQARWTARQWVTGSWSTVRPYGSGGAYVNYPDLDLPAWARAYHGDNLERLIEVKAKYDPTALFRSPQAVPLTGVGSAGTGA
ncbi:MAG TPA: FAD-binding oxidoreductase [Micromonosporaceae bacterium]